MKFSEVSVGRAAPRTLAMRKPIDLKSLTFNGDILPFAGHNSPLALEFVNPSEAATVTSHT